MLGLYVFTSILSNYRQRYFIIVQWRLEIINVSIFFLLFLRDRQLLNEAGRTDGRPEGRKDRRTDGRKEGRREGRTGGRKEGRKEGRKAGRTDDRKEGRTDGRTEGRKDRRKDIHLVGMVLCGCLVN
jgi:hypothetical protein